VTHCYTAATLGPNKKINTNNEIKFNFFDSVKGLTASVIKSLTADECNNLLNAYTRGFLGFSRLKDVMGAPYSKEALDDLTQSSAH